MTTQTTSDNPSTPVLTDPRPHFAEALATARATIAAVEARHMERPTPCTEFDVRTLLAHLTAVVWRIAAVGEGKHAFSVPDEVEGVADDAWVAAFDEACERQHAVWSDDSVLSTVIHLPWASMPGAATLGVYTNEVSVHTWDLATAIGAAPQWSDGALDLALQTMTFALPSDGRTEAFDAVRASMPDDQRDFTAPFGEAVPVGGDAPLIDRLVAWNGRNPR